MSNIIMQFPGQGSQKINMLQDYSKVIPSIKEVFQLASDICQKNIWRIVQEGPEALLNDTTITQPAMLAADVAIWQAWRDASGAQPFMVAGHSLGEYAALVAAECLHLEDAMQLVHKRAQYMATAQAPGVGAVGVIIGFDECDVATWCDVISTPAYQVSIANINSAQQLVVAGHKEAVEAVLALAKKNKARIARLLPVSVPVHCALMKDAAKKLRQDLDSTTFHQPIMPVVFNVDAQQYDAPDQIKQALYEQLFSPVQWLKTMEVFYHHAPDALVESGPGGVLSGMYKRSYKHTDSAIINLNHYANFQKDIVYG